MSAAAGSRYSRVIVTLDTSVTGRGVLDAAVILAKALHAELAGLFVEDTNLLRVAALPFTRESGLASGTLREFETENVLRALKAQAQCSRLMLADAARAVALRWTFAVVQGSGMTAALESRGERDLLVMGNVFYAGAGSPAPHPIARSRPRDHQPLVAVVYDGSANSERAVRAAHEVAAEIGAPLLVLNQCESPSAARLHQDLRTALPHRSLHWVLLQDSAPPALAAALRHHHAALLFWPVADTGGKAYLSRLMRQISCPLVLVE